MKRFIFLILMAATALAAASCNEKWHYVNKAGEPKFMNGWQNNDAGRSVRFIKSGDLVLIQGVMSGGPNSAVAFQLPEKYRPSRFLEIGGGTMGEQNCTITIGVDGKVAAWYVSNYNSILLNVVITTK